MSGETSDGAGKTYGLEQVCRVLEFARSTIYTQQARATAMVVPLFPIRRGPKPKMADADLLAAIRSDLATSPFTGEGHRKVWARLRILGGTRIETANDGWVWVFSAADHFDDCCVGILAVKTGNRFAALQQIA